MTEFLSSEELRQLTGFKVAGKQAAWLTEQGIAHRQVGNRIIVSRVHTQAWLEGRPVRTNSGPNWSALPQHA